MGEQYRLRRPPLCGALRTSGIVLGWSLLRTKGVIDIASNRDVCTYLFGAQLWYQYIFVHKAI